MIQFKHIPQRTAILLSALMFLLGGGLLLWLLLNLPRTTDGTARSVLASAQTPGAVVAGATDASPATATLSTTVASQSVITQPLVIGLAPGLPSELVQLVSTATLSQTTVLTLSLPAAPSDPAVTLRLDYAGQSTKAIYTYTFAAATRFDTIELELTEEAIQAAWSGTNEAFSAVAVLTDTLPALSQILGDAGETVVGYATQPEVVAAAWATAANTAPVLVLLPFDQLEPRLAVFKVDGQTPVENTNNFDAAAYPLVATVYAQDLSQTDAARTAIQDLLAALPAGNRNPDQLTVVAMTGVTAMVRLTAQQMDERGVVWLAEVVGPELASADITVISNEVPFVSDCETNTNMDNLTFCSKPEYLKALTDSGVDIIGLTGNHQNDYGREDAVASLDFYAESNLPVYGGGRNKEEAFAPYYMEHNGNRLAFLGANSYGHQFAWATDTQPGSAQFDLNIMSATIRSIGERDLADVILAELQYQETYNVTPLFDQRQNFNALIRAGADIVTGVQSHVPQAMEFNDGKLVLYGLGNLFFDQMWSQATREGMIVKHTIYNHRHLSTQVFTTLLYDYGQPRWTTPEERETILKRVYGASYWEK